MIRLGPPHRRTAAGDTQGHLSWVTNGSVGTDNQWSTFGSSTWKGTMGRSWVSNAWTSAFGANGSHRWMPDVFNSTNYTYPSSPHYGVAPLAAVWREDDLVDRSIYTHFLEFGSAEFSTHYVMQRWSTTSFYSVAGAAAMRECDSMTGFLSCSSASLISTGKLMAVAWDNRLDRSHTVYVNQNRMEDSDTREVRIATGYVDDYILPVHNSLGVNSVVTPGIACEFRFLFGYDCVVLYVPETSPSTSTSEGEVWVKRFSGQEESTKYSLNIDPNAYRVGSDAGRRTAEAITAWYQDGYFWAAWKAPLQSQQGVRIYKSAYGDSWSYVTTLGHSSVGPSAVSYYNSNSNPIALWR